MIVFVCRVEDEIVLKLRHRRRVWTDRFCAIDECQQSIIIENISREPITVLYLDA